MVTNNIEVTKSAYSYLHTNDIGFIDEHSDIVAGLTDRITPWKSVYQTSRIFRRVLSNSGHLQSLLNPPTNPKAIMSSDIRKNRTPTRFWLMESSNKEAGGSIGATGSMTVPAI